MNECETGEGAWKRADSPGYSLLGRQTWSGQGRSEAVVL